MSSGLGRRRRTTRRHMRGRGIFGDIGNWLNGAANTVYNNVLKPVGNFVKDQHLISKGLAFIPHPAGKAAAMAAGLAGLGRRRRRRRVTRGAGFLSNAHTYIKKNRLVSRGLSFASQFHKPLGKYVGVAKSLGYGRRRRRRRVTRGAGFLSNAHAYVKKNRLVSRGLSFASQFHKPLGKWVLQRVLVMAVVDV
jgi:hypothetical protein